MKKARTAYLVAKRVLDIVAAAGALTLAAVPLAVAAILIRVRLGAPILFRQVRPGRGGRPFMIFKFRTMSDARDPSGQLLPDEVRLGAFGRALRRWSVDELPQLFNVLRGDMSFIGPRPLLMQYLPLYDAWQSRRMEVRPGITGWAQVRGRNRSTWPQRFADDVYYVDHVSLGLDLRILLLTLRKVVSGDGVSAEGQATVEPFRGNP
ncbi:sugar transferase [Sphingomonas sp. PB2P19]|uniref:sugar transferase n=1 Tax=Sphingomonas rhamnosi TaxID=3096156 RepID=UPI002FCAADE4